VPTSTAPPLVLTECMRWSTPPLGTARYACRSRHTHDNSNRLGFCYLDAKETSLSPRSLARALKPKAGTIVVVHVRCCEWTSNPPDQTARWTGFYGSNNNPEPGDDEPRNVCDRLFPTSFSTRRQRFRWAQAQTSYRMPLPPSRPSISLLLRRDCMHIQLSWAFLLSLLNKSLSSWCALMCK
jgi:hypothetical protein